ncbi:hypothetical protein BDN67DRAFT_921701 [Paxillus ammoniavirescens]|nr:hypothetical protein BDN67DRAFT_921701 [Paxillus ammoniavirescens]
MVLGGILHISPRTLRIVVSTFHALSIVVTSFRLWYRSCKCQSWWEDAWVGVALGAETVSLVTIWLIWGPPSDTGRIIAYWHQITAFTVCLWSARLSVLCSIIRFSPRGGKLWKVAVISAGVFSIMFLFLLSQKIYYCAHDTWWYSLEEINCHLGTAISACQLATDAISDVVLVILPIQLVRQISVPRDQRIIVLSVFSSSILISLISVIHFAFMMEPDTYFQVLTAHLEIALSVIVCNSLVIVTCVYRILRRRDLDLDRGYTAGSRSVYFSTVMDMNELPRSQWSYEGGGELNFQELQGKPCTSSERPST